MARQRKILSIFILGLFGVFLLHQFLPHEHLHQGDSNALITHSDHHHHNTHHHQKAEQSVGLLGFLMENHTHNFNGNDFLDLINRVRPLIKVKSFSVAFLQVSSDITWGRYLIENFLVYNPLHLVTTDYHYCCSQRGPPPERT